MTSSTKALRGIRSTMMSRDNYTLRIWEGGQFRREISGLSYGEAITMAEERALSGNAITVRVYAQSGQQILHYGPYITE